MRGFINRTRAHQEVTHIQEGRTPIREEQVVLVHANRTSGKRPEIGGIGILPVIPELVDHLGETIMSENRATRTYPPYRVVHHKQGIY